ncbi:MAG: Gx transporter family protein [Clostridia bacterium]|nr:Gx transporter family protein [Clostridia bacterium]
MKFEVKKLTFLSVLSALAIILSFVESLLPPIWSAVPGIKMGLPNIIIIFLLYKFSIKEAAIVSFIRLLIVVLLFGNFMTFLYSFAGAVLSLLVMWLLKHINKFSQIGVSIVGAISHNLAQITVALLLLQTKEIGFYFPILAVSGTVAGIFVGLSGIMLLKYTAKYKI